MKYYFTNTQAEFIATVLDYYWNELYERKPLSQSVEDNKHYRKMCSELATYLRKNKE